MAVQSDLIEQIFRRVGSSKQISNTVKKGSLITFNYTFYKNDPYPLVIASRVNIGSKIWGINLHYLTFNYIKKTLSNCDNPFFSYAGSIKGDSYLQNAYRSYKWSGIRQIKVLDCDVLLDTMGTVRSIDPAEVEIIRRNAEEQINKQINPKANEVNLKTLNNIQQEAPTGIIPTIQNVPSINDPE